MHFLDDSLLPENQQKLVIQVAPYGPQWAASDSDDIPVTMDQQVQKAVDCWNAGATVLHVHVREDDGKGSKRLSKFNEMLARLREAVPQMILQVGGSISFAPESEGQAAQEVGDRLKANQPVILNLQGLPRELQRRLIDFSSGLAYAVAGSMQRVADQVFLLTPSNVEFSQEEKDRLQARGLFQP